MTINIYIGTEPSQWLATAVLKSSILRRTTKEIRFVESWTRERGWLPELTALPKLKNGTAFNTFRWLVPELAGNKGSAIYLDADQVVLTDIADLHDWLHRYQSDPEFSDVAFCAVTDAKGVFGKKTPEPGKVQTSVMVMDCIRCGWSAAVEIGLVADGKRSYADLMQAVWWPRHWIGDLPAEWNHFGIRTPETKLLHFSHVKTQPWRNPKNPVTDVWEHELRETLNAGHVSMGDLEHETREGHLASAFLKRLERTSV